MGSCVTKDKQAMQKKPSNRNRQQKQSQSTQPTRSSPQSFGITNNASTKSLKFTHSPLRYCQYLFTKFKKSDGTPEEVSLGFMLAKCVIQVQRKEINLWIINGSVMRLWVVYGGVQKVSQTGLTTQITNYKQLQQITIPTLSSNIQTGDPLEPIYLSEHPKQNILIIMSPVLDNNQTIFMIYRYQIIPQQKQYSLITQTLQWSSLSFRINDIYGAEYLFKVNDENQVCSICLTNKCACILLPCRHMCLCETCLEQVEKIKPNCPLCRKEYYSVVKYQEHN